MPIATREAQIVCDRRATASRRGSATARRPELGSLAAPDRTSTSTAPRDGGLERWRSREWQPIRYVAYRTLIDMTVFPTLSRDGVPLPNALRADRFATASSIV